MAKRSRKAAREAAQRRPARPVRGDVEGSARAGRESLSALESLAVLRTRRDELDAELRRVHAAIGEDVVRARRDRETWASIGTPLGLTGQAAGLIHRRTLDRR